MNSSNDDLKRLGKALLILAIAFPIGLGLAYLVWLIFGLE